MSRPLVSISPDASRLIGPDGKPFFAVMINYVGRGDRAWAQFQPGRFDAQVIADDFRRAAGLGANTIRTFVAGPLQNEFTRGDWTKLDAVVDAAESAGVYLWLTLADYSLSYVQTLAAHAELIAARYAGRPAILAYDLRNEPRFYHLALMRYPAGNPLLDGRLDEAYPPVRKAAEALAWARGPGRAPESMPDDEAIRYAHAGNLLERCQAAISAWIRDQHYRTSSVDFIRAAEAAAWQPFLDALDATLDAWLAPQLAALRACDPGRLVTVGWSDPLLAGLPANRHLDLISIHRYARDLSLRQLEYQMTILAGLQSAFPGRPVVLAEFGYATHEVEPERAAIAESATWLRAYEVGLAGAGKWMLWDLPPGPNPRERSFGLVDPAGEAKPSALALSHLAAHLATARAPRGRLALSADGAGGVAYVYRAEDAYYAAGSGSAGDAVVRWEGAGPAHLFVDRPEPAAWSVRATAAGRVTLDPAALAGMPDPAAIAVEADGRPWPHERAGRALALAVEPHHVFTVRFAPIETHE